MKYPEGISEAHLTGACRARAMGDGRIAESTAFAFVGAAFQPR